jgi:hypothetical protein
MARNYQMQDDSVTVRGKGHPELSGKSVTRRGETVRRKGAEPGRYDGKEDIAPPGTEEEHSAGLSTARDSSSVYPQDPIDKRSPNLRTP